GNTRTNRNRRALRPFMNAIPFSICHRQSYCADATAWWGRERAALAWQAVARQMDRQRGAQERVQDLWMVARRTDPRRVKPAGAPRLPVRAESLAAEAKQQKDRSNRVVGRQEEAEADLAPRLRAVLAPRLVSLAHSGPALAPTVNCGLPGERRDAGAPT